MDIVERLVNFATSDSDAENLMNESATEIGQLRKDVVQLKWLMQGLVDYTGVYVSSPRFTFHPEKRKEQWILSNG
jgi:hypothetical protein